MLESTVDHLLKEVLAAAHEYDVAEGELSKAYRADPTPAAWEDAARVAKRRACFLAIAIDGLADRCKNELGLSLAHIRSDVSALCCWPGTCASRTDAVARIRGVANAYKHQNLSDPSLPIASEADILVVGLGYGRDGWGVGKFGGVEVLVRETAGDTYKFLGDAPVVIAAWFMFLAQKGATNLPPGPVTIFNLQLHP